ncbi:hypothetical protein GCM10023189_48750 [Nibrella saemangeumensis]|uniref:Uncharacterized protein n=1 Tax=Nibrella saemangeumensis TaxID=1084526 RepID=A0ABP8NJE8_9BACT
MQLTPNTTSEILIGVLIPVESYPILKIQAIYILNSPPRIYMNQILALSKKYVQQIGQASCLSIKPERVTPV